ncbi:hypothetical protein MMC17_009530 [Xylographa soralifera]|nr:hypothetical protein [Xylographa soralifera]
MSRESNTDSDYRSELPHTRTVDWSNDPQGRQQTHEEYIPTSQSMRRESFTASDMFQQQDCGTGMEQSSYAERRDGFSTFQPYQNQSYQALQNPYLAYPQPLQNPYLAYLQPLQNPYLAHPQPLQNPYIENDQIQQSFDDTFTAFPL